MYFFKSLLRCVQVRTKIRRKNIGVLYPGSPVRVQKSGYDRFPPAVNSWGIKHPISDTVPPLLSEEEDYQPEKN
jgi:hypothetical protein